MGDFISHPIWGRFPPPSTTPGSEDSENLLSPLTTGILPAPGTNGNGQGGQSSGPHTPNPLPTVLYEDLALRPRIPQRFLIESVLPAEEGMLLSAKERSFKSFLTMEFAKAVCTGRPLFGVHAVPRAAHVLLVDLENTYSRLCDRMDASLRHDGLLYADLGKRLHVFDRAQLNKWEFDAVGLGRLEDTIAQDQPELVILDNLRKATPPGKDERDIKDMLPLVRALAQMCESYHTALVLVHHDTRDGTRYSGSGALSGSLANEVHVMYDRKERLAVVTCESMRNAEPFDPFAIAMAHDDALVLVDLPDKDEEDPIETTEDKIVEIVQGGARSIAEIADAVGISEHRVRKTIDRMKKTQRIVEIGLRQGGVGKPATLFGLPAEFDLPDARTADPFADLSLARDYPVAPGSIEDDGYGGEGGI